MARRSELRCIATCLALALASGAASAQSRSLTVGPCRLSVPTSWTASGAHLAGPGGSGDIDEVSNGQASFGMEAALPGSIVTHQDGDRKVIQIAAPNGAGLVFAVAPAQPDSACRVQFRVENAAALTAATAAARTLKRN